MRKRPRCHAQAKKRAEAEAGKGRGAQEAAKEAEASKVKAEEQRRVDEEAEQERQRKRKSETQRADFKRNEAEKSDSPRKGEEVRNYVDDPRDAALPGEMDELELERRAFEQAEKAVRDEEARQEALKFAADEAKVCRPSEAAGPDIRPDVGVRVPSLFLCRLSVSCMEYWSACSSCWRAGVRVLCALRAVVVTACSGALSQNQPWRVTMSEEGRRQRSFHG